MKHFPRGFTHLAALALATLTACHADQSATGDAAKRARASYARGYNLVLKDTRQLLDDYFRTLPEPKPENPHLFPDQQSIAGDLRDARAAFEAAKHDAPAALASLGPIADRTLAVTDKIVASYTAAQQYYDAEKFKDDGLATGKRLHAELQAEAKELDAALGAFGDGMSALEDTQAADDLAQYADAKDYSYWFREFTLEAKRFVATADRVQLPADRAKLTAAFDAIETAHAGLAHLVAAKGAGVSTAFTSYVGQADRFEAAATKLVRDVTGGAKLDDTEVVSAYNSLIQIGNSLYQVEAAGGLK